MISPLAHVDAGAKIGKNVTIHPFAYVEGDVVIGDNSVIMPYVSILDGARIGSDNTIYHGSVIGAVPQDFEYSGEKSLIEIGNNNNIREHVVINRATHAGAATKIGDGCFIMQAARISHDVVVGNGCIIGNDSQIAGCARVDDNAIVSACVLINQGCRVGSWSVVQGGCRTSKDIPPYIIAAHEPVAFHAINTKVMTDNGFKQTTIMNIASAYRLLYQFNTTLDDALGRIREQVDKSDEIDHIIDFIERSKRGIIK